ncbi:hypothetical protein Aoki45_27590 [Algoriphagus sp. oki45]|uniref:hypothetical protein n=1 Tax=Algoriphagus sp. oki45 TaxID=3067294 RepID=UPI0027F96B16|nr:hypothetical protein Aoki45_27590 [Algoriphagus sp. oki45]
MSQLNGIIASILSDINEAKSKADEASREIAKAYASDQILRYFPVPRIGIQNLEVEIKYAVTRVEEKPANPALSKQRLADLAANFSKETAAEIKSQVKNLTQTNELYKGLGNSYPSDDWEKSLSEQIEDTLLEGIKTNDPIKMTSLVKDSFSKSLQPLFPVVQKSASLAVVPLETGEFQVIGLDKKGQSEFAINERFDDSAKALAEAKLFSESLKKGKVEVGAIKKDTDTKTEIAKVKVGNKEVEISASSQKIGAANSKAFFDKSVSEKALAVNKSTVIKPVWMGGISSVRRPGGNNPTPNPKDDFEEDRTMVQLAERVLAKKMPLFESSASKILSENVVTKLQVSVDSEAISKAKPESIATIRFTLGSQDFTLLDDDNKTSIL